MCGIVGTAGVQVQDRQMELALQSMHDRGPDARKYIKISESLAFGATRLAMVDPHPRSNQPFIDEASGDSIVFNGEIYNYLELREELKKDFPELIFKTESDTEVLLLGLQLRGLCFVNSLNGMFSFSFFSHKGNSILLGRDLQGKKPLYFHESPEGIVWGSTLKAIALLIEKKQITNLDQYLQVGYFIDPNTPYRNVKELMPGTLLKYEITQNKLTLSRISPIRTVRTKPPQTDQLREALKLAVSRRIKDQNTVAISLSGGVDSAVIAIILAELGAKTVAYSSHWEDKDKEKYNLDCEIAESIAINLGIDFKKVAMPNSRDIKKVLTEFLQATQEPNNNPTGLSMMNLYRQISEDNIRLVLTGDGADEILAGYDRYNKVRRIPHFMSIPENNVTQLLANSLSKVSTKAHKALVSQFELQSTMRWMQWHQLFELHEQRKILGSSEFWGSGQFSSYVQSFCKNMDLESPVQSLMEIDSRIWLAMESNRKLDRISMSFSIEARCPFQDLEVKEISRELMNNSNYGILGKKHLWQAFPELIDLNVRTDKYGFISPVGHWLRNNPDLISESIDYLCKNLSSDRSYLERLERGVNQGDFTKIKKTWAFVVLARWLSIDAD